MKSNMMSKAEARAFLRRAHAQYVVEKRCIEAMRDAWRPAVTSHDAGKAVSEP